MIDRRIKSRWIVTIPSGHQRKLSILYVIRKNYELRIRVEPTGELNNPSFIIYVLDLKDMKEIKAYVAGIFAGLEMMA